MVYFVYILTDKRNGTLYIGSTTDLVRRMQEHRLGTFQGFTSKYKLHKLIYVERYLILEEARIREKRLKKWNLFRKIEMIELLNPEWTELNPNEWRTIS